MRELLWGKFLNQSSISNAQIKRAVGEEARLSFRNAVAVLALIFSLHSHNSFAVTDDIIPFYIPQQRADTALTLFAEQANLTLVFPFDKVREKTANRLVGDYPVHTAVKLLLDNTGLTPTFSDQLVLNIAIETKGKSMNIKHRKSLLATLVGLFAAGGAATATAQDEMQESSRVQRALEEIVVTATKKGSAENLQDVPIAMSAFNSEQLDGLFFENLTDIGKRAPNVILDSRSSNPSQSSFFIRGVGSALETVSSDPAVGVVIDGMALNSSVGILTDMFDVESVEVLRGPQGTLFGRNATGGVVSIKTKRPTGEFHSSIRGTYGSYGRQDVAFSVEDSLIDGELAARFSVMYKDHEGYYRNDVDPGDRVGDARQSTARTAIRWNPSEELTLDLTLEYGEADFEAVPARNISNIIGFVPNPDPSVVSMNYTGQGDESHWGHAILEANWDLGEGVLTSITGYRKFYTDSSADLDGTGDFTAFNINGDGGTAMWLGHWSEELRYAKNIGENIQLTSGVYYFSSNFHELSQWGGDNDNNGGFFGDGEVDHKIVGVFSQGEINITENVIFTIGGRYTQEDKEADIGFVGSCDNNHENCLRFKDDQNWSNFSYRLGLQWMINDDSHVYATINRGFRSGGYNIETFAGGNPGPYDEEVVDAFELGWKSQLLNDKIRLNLATFYNQYDDFQVQALFKVPDQLVRVQGILNAAEVEMKGVEAEVNALITDRLSVSASVGILDHEIKSIYPIDVNNDGIEDPELSKELELGLVPDLTYNLSVLYDIPVLDLGLITLRANYSYKDETFGAGAQNILLTDEIAKTDISATFLSSNEKLRVSLFGKNITDELSSQKLTPNNREAFNNIFYAAAPRTWGVEVQYNFD
ncbi:TonB-dependent receptor [Porticoccaceae bacterium]|nr:TonB-dependent receptor [Porticoccaceae bacterium]